MSNMESADKIIRFPDGKGGFILKRRDASGAWVALDGEKPVEEATSAGSATETAASPSMKKKTGAKSVSFGESPARCIGVRIPPDLEEDLDDFVRWKSFTSRERVTKSSAVREAVECLFKKYPGFKEYRKRR